MQHFAVAEVTVAQVVIPSEVGPAGCGRAGQGQAVSWGETVGLQGVGGDQADAGRVVAPGVGDDGGADPKVAPFEDKWTLGGCREPARR